MDINGKQITIVRADNMVGVDGLYYNVDCSALDSNLHVVHWDGEHAEVEWTDKDNTFKDNIDLFMSVVDAWQATQDFLKAQALDPFHGLNEAETLQLEYQNSLETILAQFFTDSNAPVEVGGILYNGGEASARAINDAVTLAGVLNETTCYIAGLDNIARVMSFANALNVAAQIGKAWRTAYFTMQTAKVALTQGD